jgi:hypothetical protein
MAGEETVAQVDRKRIHCISGHKTCHNRSMPSRSSQDHDFTTVAKRVVKHAFGEEWDGLPSIK